MTVRLRVAFALAALLACAPRALADGGEVVLHQVSGPFAVTVFVTPEPLSTGDEDLSVLVQDAASQQAVLDAAVDLPLSAPEEPSVSLHAGHSAASNRLLQAAGFHFAHPGPWQLAVAVRRGSQQAICAATIHVAASHARRTVVWTLLLLPLILVALFIVHQKQKAQLAHFRSRR